ncbi:MAG: sugar phosphate isomerase/epimerase family protein [Kiritimatiellia bacterium]
MAEAQFPVNFGTVLLESNRWTPEKIPTYRVSEWAAAIHDAGFSGLELWENHAALADEAEQVALSRLSLPVVIFNSYCTFDDAGAGARQRAAEYVRRFGARGVKFNFGNEAARTDEYVRNLRAWADTLPAGCRLLCECHGGTVLETPEQVARVLAPLAGRVEIIVHPFAGERATLQQWLDGFGPAVTHVHVAGLRGKWPMIRLEEMADEAQARLALLRKAGFAGTWTLEFTGGVAQSPEDRHTLLAHAAADLAFLRKHGRKLC